MRACEAAGGCYDGLMPDMDYELLKFVFWVVTHPRVWMRIRRNSRDQEPADKKFRSLRDRVVGLLEQVQEGAINDAARSVLAGELEALVSCHSSSVG